MMSGTAMIDQMFTGMANGKDVMADMAKNNSDPNAKAMMELFYHPYPWHAAACGDLDLTGFRKPQSYYRDIVWNGGDRVYATVRLPEPEGKKIIAIMWATYPTLSSWTWPGEEGKALEVEVYSGTEKVRLFLNDKLIGEKPTGREQEFKAVFSVPYVPGTLKVVGLRNDRVVAESVLTTAEKAVKLRVTADRMVLQADGQDLSFATVEAVDANGRPNLEANQEVQFEISGPGLIAAVGNGDGQDADSYHGNRRKLYQGRALVVIRASRQIGLDQADRQKLGPKRWFSDDRCQSRAAACRIALTRLGSTGRRLCSRNSALWARRLEWMGQHQIFDFSPSFSVRVADPSVRRFENIPCIASEGAPLGSRSGTDKSVLLFLPPLSPRENHDRNVLIPIVFRGMSRTFQTRVAAAYEMEATARRARPQRFTGGRNY